MNKIKIGTKVKLKSGSPEMIIDSYQQGLDYSSLNDKPHEINIDRATCVWFLGDKPQKQEFHVDTLEIID